MTAIATLGSHCALQVLKGAKDEGLKTLLVCEKRRQRLYKRFDFIDEIIPVDSFLEVLEPRCARILEKNKAVLIPHGTLIAQMSSEQIESIKTPVFGNKWILRWESDRNLKEKLMRDAKLDVPKSIPNPDKIKRLTIAKRHGAAGGKGYFLTSSKKDYVKKRNQLIKMGLIKGDKDLYLQEYVMGVLAYLQFFYSPLDDNLEFFGVDKRHESDIEGLGRIPAQEQLGIDYISSFNVIGNSPMVLRESLLDDVYAMGERFVEASRRLVKPGMNGPFCIEGVYDQNGKFWTFEFSARIVAGTNIYMEGSPYSALMYDVPMSMGRRIAREVKKAKKQNKLDLITT
ncbi:MAG: formate--phosphoribosylaminoimidazolecarboxamide ligase [Candidatus Nitrosotenuis sp.]|uniref:5-formaminoimidazole-4-carboxamide-1-(beta)-D-ribofuranosyl 5'-monophosphate synthetase n=1 Tax=Candidatus Nitrosotenuis uzonensis TaxID=1407055 RepID=A0A812F1T9_9ARCH|nr:formate--phosphoribosylaminoimidazolecarboxamide ligase [Candidatus Nitrosotenuis uzonensis]MCA2004068.1 formate--phosphoribosylaminoimidazolecarboxamide ligase [Candidatus Nitrosotenuis sp.]CAE6499128.1 5-formaminoimidazole-4-carboxamide-1-(beta)-D-ribofuranosyl 5'-monophosphate synthetase [Candidatus Nitrosotenuis uzonensis]